jgi:hypothetical protein
MFVFKTELRSDFSGRDVTVQTGIVCLSIGKEEEACRMGPLAERVFSVTIQEAFLSKSI